MNKTRRQTIRQKAVSELERLSQSLDEALEMAANLPIAEIDEELREMGVDPDQLPSLNFDQMLDEKSEQESSAYGYVSDVLLRDEPITDEVKLLILELRHLTRQQRYEEALELAERATLLAPDYWRALNSYGSLMVLLGKVDEGEAIFRRVLEDFSVNPKAVAAALHGCACVKEIKYKFNPSEGDLQEVLHLYEEALEFDDSRANTRACLVINSLLSHQTNKGMKILEESLLCEGFFDAMSLELGERRMRTSGAHLNRVVQVFPTRFKNLLYNADPSHAGGMESSITY